MSFISSSNNIQSSPPYYVGIKIKVAPEEIYNEELPAVIEYYYIYFPLVVDDYLNMGDMML